jgi:CheY-like chemotaxis protein
MSKQILVIEDDHATGVLYRAILAERSYEMLYAANGSRGLEMAETQQPDLILLDMRLPQMAGLDVARSLRENPATAQIPIIVISANLDTPDGDRMRRLGCDAFLSKPFMPQELYRVIESLSATAED